MSEPTPYVPPGPPYPQQVAPKNPALGLIVSFFIPGLGSLINGATATGLIILGGYLVSCVLMLILIGFLTAPIFWIWGMIDGYQSAVRWNARHGIIS